MIQYYGYTISPNQIETGEGFLICRNVPLARVGDQEYLGLEIGLTGPDAEKVITVHRPEKEVFSEAALASFEGKPVTNDHPPDLIGPDDVSMYERGHVQTIRRGTAEWADFMIGDLHVHERGLIDDIKNGKREVSCGYECEYIPNGDGSFTQRNIRGNHVAVVNRARAGKRAAILDTASYLRPAEKPPERKAKSMKKSILQLFGLAAKDKTPEEIEKLAMDTADAMEEEDKASSETAEGTADGASAEESMIVDENILNAIADKVIAKMKASAKQAAADAADKDPMDAAIESLTKDEEGTEEKAEGEAKVVPAEEMDKAACGMDKALAASILKAMRPAVAAIKDEKERLAVSDALIKCVTVDAGNENSIAALLKTVQRNAQSRAGAADSAKQDETLQNFYREQNPHTRTKKEGN